MSSASSLGIGLSALQASQRGLELAGQNISNVNTPGYARQRLDQAAQSSTVVPSMFGRTMATGEGVTVLGTTRIQDQLLEVRALQSRGAATAAATAANGYSMVEAAFGEPGDTGLQAGLAQFWTSWGDLATDPGSSAARTSVLEQGGRLAASFRELAGRLSTQWGGTREALDASVATVNRLTGRRRRAQRRHPRREGRRARRRPSSRTGAGSSSASSATSSASSPSRWTTAR